MLEEREKVYSYLKSKNASDYESSPVVFLDNSYKNKDYKLDFSGPLKIPNSNLQYTYKIKRSKISNRRSKKKWII